VALDIAIRFSEPPPACKTDKLSDAICYDALMASVREFVGGKEFLLLEKLSYDLFQLIKAQLPESAKLWLQTTKVKPPINELENGVSFSYGEFEE
jgi:dihydroneopterin aldolase